MTKQGKRNNGKPVSSKKAEDASQSPRTFGVLGVQHRSRDERGGALGAQHRSRNKHGGVKDDLMKPRMSLLPLLATMEEAKVMTYGAEKYSSHNWIEGFDHLTLADSLMRHLFAWLMGEDIDPESGCHHLAHIRANAGMLYDITQLYPERDNRWPKWHEHKEAVEKAKAAFDPSDAIGQLFDKKL